jgi:hypothetical protein
LNEEAAHSEVATAGLKHGTGKNAHIVLAPQPSEDPNDPLNWSAWKKEICLLILIYGAMLNAATNGPLLNASTVVIADDLGVSITSVAVLGGYNLLAAGCTGYVSRNNLLIKSIRLWILSKIWQASDFPSQYTHGDYRHRCR